VLKALAMNCCIYPNTGNDGCRGAAAADSAGHTSRHDSQPVQLSALITASSLGRFFRGFS